MTGTYGESMSRAEAMLWGLCNIGSPAEAVIYGAELARQSRGGSLDAEPTQSREQTTDRAEQ